MKQIILYLLVVTTLVFSTASCFITKKNVKILWR